VHDNGIRRRAFGPQGEHVMGDWRKIWNETLKLLFSSYIVLLGQLYTIIQNYTQLYKIVTRKPEENKRFRRTKCGCKSSMQRVWAVNNWLKRKTSCFPE
jgi:hypothetical protein